MEGQKIYFYANYLSSKGVPWTDSIYMIISFEGKLPWKLLILSLDCIEVTLDYCLWCLFWDTKNNE